MAVVKARLLRVNWTENQAYTQPTHQYHFLFWSFNLTRQFFLANYVSPSEFSSETLMVPPQRWIIMPLSSTKMIQTAIPGRKEIFSRGATKCPRSLIIDKLKRRSWTTSSAPRSMIPESGLQGSIRLVKLTLLQNNRKISCVFLDGPSLVYVNVFVRSFSSIDDVKMVRIVFSKLFLKIPRWMIWFEFNRNVKFFHFKLNFSCVLSGIQFSNNFEATMERQEITLRR